MLRKLPGCPRLQCLASGSKQLYRSTARYASGESAIPFVDVSPWVRGTDELSMLQSARELGHAFERTGFAVVLGHGVPPESVCSMTQAMKGFFEGPQYVKEAVRARPVHGAQGFHSQGHENVAQLLGDFSRPADLVERMTFVDLHRVGATASNAWGHGGEQEEPKFPETPGFRGATAAYTHAITDLWERLTRMSEVALGVPTNYMDRFYGERRGTTLQLARYLRAREDPNLIVEEDGIAFGAHTDSGGLTILYTTGPGLEVELAHGWHPVPVVEGAFLVNVGRLLSRWTNDRWLASVHRVRNLSGQSSQKLSIVQFTSPHGEAIIEPLPTCVAPGSAPKYGPVRVRDFMYQRHLLHIPPEQRRPEEREVSKEFWEAARVAARTT